MANNTSKLCFPFFSFFLTFRQYNRLVKNRKIDLEEYEREKEAVGEDAFYGRDNTIAIGLHKDSKEAIDGMVDDLEKQ